VYRPLRNTIFGRPMQQGTGVLVLWEHVLLNTKFSRIIELGTGWGGLSLYFALWCEERGAKFHTFDIAKKWKDTPLAKMICLASYFHVLDVLHNPQPIKELIVRPGPSIVFCDNGDKREEFRQLAPILKPGDIIGVHDWGREIGRRDVTDVMVDHLLDVIELDLCRITDSHTRLFKKREISCEC